MNKPILLKRIGTLFFSIFFIVGVMTTCQGPRQEEDDMQTSGVRTVIPEHEVLKFLDTLFVYGQEHDMYNVPHSDGEFLRFLAASSGAQRALEIGSSNGLSAIWIGLGLKETGGKLITIEIDHDKAQAAKENIRKVGMQNIIEVIEGDAFKVIPDAEGTFDFVHLDAWKEDYKRFFDIFYPKVERGGVIAAHNAVLMASYMQDYLDAVKNDPELISVIAQTSSDGFSVSFRKSDQSGGEQ